MMEEQKILRLFETRRASARLELAWLDAEIELLKARREALGRFLEQGLFEVAAREATQASSAAQRPPISGSRPKRRASRAASDEPNVSAAENSQSSRLRDVILGVLREAAPEALRVGEIGRLAKAEIGAATLEKTPGTILNTLKKQGLVERMGHRWRLDPEA